MDATDCFLEKILRNPKVLVLRFTIANPEDKNSDFVVWLLHHEDHSTPGLFRGQQIRDILHEVKE